MAPKTSTVKTSAKTDAAGRRVAKKGEPALASYVEKDITPVMKNYTEWLEQETGYPVDERTVQLAGVLRSRFQKSDFNQERITSRAEEREQEAAAREERRIAREQAKAERDAARAAKAAEPKAEKKVVEKKVAAKPAAKTAAAKPAAKKTAPATKTAAAKPATRRRPAKPAAEGDF